MKGACWISWLHNWALHPAPLHLGGLRRFLIKTFAGANLEFN